jgi:hypothetical protein
LRKKRSRLAKAGRSTEIVDAEISALNKEDVWQTFLRKQEAETIYKKHLHGLQVQIRFLRKNSENSARLAELELERNRLKLTVNKDSFVAATMSNLAYPSTPTTTADAPPPPMMSPQPGQPGALVSLQQQLQQQQPPPYLPPSVAAAHPELILDYMLAQSNVELGRSNNTAGLANIELARSNTAVANAASRRRSAASTVQATAPAPAPLSIAGQGAPAAAPFGVAGQGGLSATAAGPFGVAGQVSAPGTHPPPSAQAATAETGSVRPPRPQSVRKMPARVAKAGSKSIKARGSVTKRKIVKGKSITRSATDPTVGAVAYALPFHLEDWKATDKVEELKDLWDNFITTLQDFHREGDVDSVGQLYYRFLAFLLVDIGASAWDHVFAPENNYAVQHALAYAANVTNGDELKTHVMQYLQVGFSKGKPAKLRELDFEDELDFVDVTMATETVGYGLYTFLMPDGEKKEASISWLQLKASLK